VIVLRFTVEGTPQPGGSKRAFNHPKLGRAVIVDANDKKLRPWRKAIQEAARAAVGDQQPATQGLDVTMIFYAPRPKSHYRTGKSTSHLLRPDAPRAWTSRPDALKLARAAEDALTGIVWRDDAQIITERITKLYGSPARLEITVMPWSGCDELMQPPAGQQQLDAA
jgi:Holliday junction resolvase RusA-like endonuclease